MSYPKFYLYHRIVRAKMFIDEHFAEDIDIDNIADEASFSKYHFIRTFKTIYGITPRKYLISKRVDKAQEMLKAGSTVTETCFKVGFQSLTTFSGLFKKNVGMKPLQFQKKQKALKKDMIEKPFHFVPACFVHQNGWIEKSNFQEVLE
ncbi:MAG: AraC family transcriptional regulator [Cytophagales bacterium]|nr:AraC family transcriptional regulator [Cytophagales bacterium]